MIDDQQLEALSDWIARMMNKGIIESIEWKHGLANIEPEGEEIKTVSFNIEDLSND